MSAEELKTSKNKPEKKKDTSAGMLIVLTVTAIIVGAALAGFYQLVSPRIEANRLAEEKRAIFAVLEDARGYDIVEREILTKRGKETVQIFVGKDEAGEVAGLAFLAKGPGFQGIITMMVGLNVDMQTLANIQVIDQVETPGLGNKISEARFTDQFKGLHIKPRIEYIKNKKPEKPFQIQAITGATISSKAVVKIINERVELIINALKKKPLPLVEALPDNKELLDKAPEPLTNDKDILKKKDKVRK